MAVPRRALVWVLLPVLPSLLAQQQVQCEAQRLHWRRAQLDWAMLELRSVAMLEQQQQDG